MIFAEKNTYLRFIFLFLNRRTNIIKNLSKIHMNTLVLHHQRTYLVSNLQKKSIFTFPFEIPVTNWFGLRNSIKYFREHFTHQFQFIPSKWETPAILCAHISTYCSTFPWECPQSINCKILIVINGHISPHFCDFVTYYWKIGNIEFCKVMFITKIQEDFNTFMFHGNLFLSYQFLFVNCSISLIYIERW